MLGCYKNILFFPSIGSSSARGDLPLVGRTADADGPCSGVVGGGGGGGRPVQKERLLGLPPRALVVHQPEVGGGGG